MKPRQQVSAIKHNDDVAKRHMIEEMEKVAEWLSNEQFN
jgi:hypothetical protein